MMDREEAFRQYVEQYDIEVPAEKLDNDLNYIRLEMRHRMQYDTLTTGALHIFPQLELAQREEELRAAALHEAKSDLVMKELLRKLNPIVTPEELASEAEAMAVRQNTTVDMLKSFFGEDLAMLARDVKENKVKDWVLRQMQ